MSKNVAVIMGVGAEQGLGAKLAIRFAQNDLHVFIGGRTQEKLDAVAESIREVGGEATGVVADATDEQSVATLLKQASDAGTVRLAIYNAGNNWPGDFLTMKPEYFENSWRVVCYGGFLFSQQAMRLMVPEGEGVMLFTGASASLRGKPYFSAFTAAKAGLRMLAQSLAREFQPKGIHVGHVVIDGAIDGDQFNLGMPEFAEAFGEDGKVDLDGIVDVYEMLYRQPRKAWTHEIDVRTYREEF